MTLQYNNAAHKHAVTNAGSNSYQYDANGNQTTRVIGAQTYTLGYDAENRLVSVAGPALTASFVYDGDGGRVKSTVNGVLTTFVGAHYEITGTTATKYYFAGTQRVAIRAGTTLSYLLSDHLGSTSITTNGSGALVSELRYKPWGEVRYSSGTTSTKYTFTGQYSYQLDFGLLFYNARMYDPYLNHFTQPDSIVPDPYNSQDYDRYSYARNNPVRYNDPDGHESKDPCDYYGECDIEIDKANWTDEEIKSINDNLDKLDKIVGLEEAGKLNIQRRHIDFTYLIKWLFGEAPLAAYDPIFSTITFYDGTFSDSATTEVTTYHEIGHQIGYNNPEEMLEYTDKFWPGCSINTECGTRIGIPAQNIPLEDFAETFAIAVALETYNGDILPFATAIHNFPDSDRLLYMHDYIYILQNR